MASLHINDGLFEQMISRVLQKEIEAIADEEIASAQKRINERIRGSLAALTMKIMTYYEVERSSDRVIITVKNDLPS